MNAQSNFAGLKVAVTGGSSGLGLALVHQLTTAGARVVFVARGADRVARVARETGAAGLIGDVAHKDAIYPLALQITGHLDGLDLLINNASRLGPEPLALLADTECEELAAALAVNLVGPFRLTKALFGALAASARDGRGALVVNVSSDAAVEPYATWGAYSASKAGLRHMTAIWDEEARDLGIRFFSFDPGDMDTPLHRAAVPDADLSGLKRPEDSAAQLIEMIQAHLLQGAERRNAVSS